VSDGSLLAEAVEGLHPDPWRAISRERFFAEAEQAATIVDLMRLLALLGERNGHTAIHPLDDHARPLHFYPLVPYEFEDGMVVVSSDERDALAGELLAVDGVPINNLMAAVTPLVAHDNEWTIRARRPVFCVTAEILHELGITGDDAASMHLGRHEVRLEPIPATEFRSRLGGGDPLPGGVEDRRIERIGHAVLVTYHVTRGDTSEFAREIEATAAGYTDRVVLDLRRNGGGNNQTYGPLLEALERLDAAGKRIVVLTSRVTFSAAMQLVVDLEQRTQAVFAGEPTGGSPNQYGDAQPVELPDTGLTARIATVSWTTAGADDERVAREPDVPVPLTASAWFAGEDPVLRAALAV
jgi:hypothetical protein